MKATTIVGHKNQRTLLERLFLKDRLPHALLFSGPGGIGKRQTAYELAAAIYCEKNSGANSSYKACGKCKNCMLFASDNIPDFKEIDCLERTNVNAENIRELLYSLNLNSFFSGKRIVILNNAEFLPVQSANILLKSLEEPRKDTHFILISANPYRLPQTLLSRCQIMHFNVLSPAEIDVIFNQNKNNLDLSEALKAFSGKDISLGEIAKYSQGSFENLTGLISNIDSWLEIRQAVANICAGDLSSAAQLSEKLSKDKDNLRNHLKILTALVRTQMVNSKNNLDFERLAVSLTNLTLAERLIFERNLSASYVLNFILIGLASRENSASFTAMDESVTMLANC